MPWLSHVFVAPGLPLFLQLLGQPEQQLLPPLSSSVLLQRALWLSVQFLLALSALSPDPFKNQIPIKSNVCKTKFRRKAHYRIGYQFHTNHSKHKIKPNEQRPVSKQWFKVDHKPTLITHKEPRNQLQTCENKIWSSLVQWNLAVSGSHKE